MEEIPSLNRQGGLAAAESFAWHRQLIEQHSGGYDPRVLTRILRGRDITTKDYEELVQNRSRIRSAAEPLFDSANIWLLPTVPRIAPPLAELESSDEAYFAANAAMLRNPSIFNFLDACSLSCHAIAPVKLRQASCSRRAAETTTCFYALHWPSRMHLRLPAAPSTANGRVNSAPQSILPSARNLSSSHPTGERL